MLPREGKRQFISTYSLSDLLLRILRRIEVITSTLAVTGEAKSPLHPPFQKTKPTNLGGQSLFGAVG